MRSYNDDVYCYNNTTAASVTLDGRRLTLQEILKRRTVPNIVKLKAQQHKSLSRVASSQKFRR